MPASTLALRLTDILEAIEHIRTELAGVTIDSFEVDWRKRWLVERGVEIISEASRRLTDELKARHPEILWTKVAGIGNVLRHDYERISAPVMWKLVQDDLALGDGPPRGTGERTSRRAVSRAGLRQFVRRDYRPELRLRSRAPSRLPMIVSQMPG